MRWLLLAAAVAPIVLLYIVVRDHELSWPRGEMTAVIGIIAFGLTAYVGIIDRPGEPPSEISLGFGWYISLLGTIMIAVGGAYRASTTERPASHRECFSGPSGGPRALGRAQPVPGCVLGRGKGSAIAPSLRPCQASACIPPKHTRTHRRNH